ncbi:MAG TPA: hypothetical protein VES40_06705 [Ilumatobacteraceae bacterium]|nr:hypothetical protein [Ilumatobacteraceae bacterium]
MSDDAWARLVSSANDPAFAASFETAFNNGRAFLEASDALRGRRPLRVEWKGPHRPPGDDVIPADLRIDHVFLVSCKYLSKVLLNPGPQRLFERLLVGEQRVATNWFAECAPVEFQTFYEAALANATLTVMPTLVGELSKVQQKALKQTLAARTLPVGLADPWSALCTAVATESARRWNQALSSKTARLRLLWKLLRISSASYFVLGTDKSAHLRLRVDSAWDWNQAYELTGLTVAARQAGQPEVAWHAVVRRRIDGAELSIDGHVEIRWSHGRFVGVPESKVYLDTPHGQVPGYHALT